jgi:hypothetical protein
MWYLTLVLSLIGFSLVLIILNNHDYTFLPFRRSLIYQAILSVTGIVSLFIVTSLVGAQDSGVPSGRKFSFGYPGGYASLHHRLISSVPFGTQGISRLVGILLAAAPFRSVDCSSCATLSDLR